MAMETESAIFKEVEGRAWENFGTKEHVGEGWLVIIVMKARVGRMAASQLRFSLKGKRISREEAARRVNRWHSDTARVRELRQSAAS